MATLHRPFLRNAALTLVLLSTLSACSNIECPLDNQVVMTLTFWDTQSQKELTLSDTLSIYGVKNGNEEILFNRGHALKRMRLPLNAASTCDTLLLKFSNAQQHLTDTLWVKHDPHPHFEALDCPASTFHRVKSIAWKAQNISHTTLALDSVEVVNPNVQYEDVENLKVYLRTPAQQ